jgi:hypothetical protein
MNVLQVKDWQIHCFEITQYNEQKNYTFAIFWVIEFYEKKNLKFSVKFFFNFFLPNGVLRPIWSMPAKIWGV